MSARPRLLVLDDREGKIEAAPAIERLRELADVEVLRKPLSEVDDADLKDVRVVMAIRERTRFDAQTLARLPALELILQTGSHAYHVDTEAAKRQGVQIVLQRRGTAARAAVPELTFGLMIAAIRDFPLGQRNLVDGQWPDLVGRCLAGRRLGLLGVGRHGVRVARVGEAFGMDVVAWARPGSSATEADDGIPRLELDELLATCDVVSIHLKLSDESRGLLDRARLVRFKPGAILVNTARGAIVDEAALVDVLREGPLAAAGLDVFTTEPLPADSPLLTLPNVVLTPHVGWTVEEVFSEFAAIAADQLEAFLDDRLDPAELMRP